jgi:hypothetical protein
VSLRSIVTTAVLAASLSFPVFAERKIVPVHVYYDQHVARYYCDDKPECPILHGYFKRVIAHAQHAWDRATTRNEEFQIKAITLRPAAQNNDAEYHINTIALDERTDPKDVNVYFMGQPFAPYTDGDQKPVEGFTFGESVFLVRTLQITPRLTYIDEKDDMDTFLHEHGHGLGGIELTKLYGPDVQEKFRTTYSANSWPEFYLDFGNEFLINHSDRHGPTSQRFKHAKERFPDLPELIEVLKYTRSDKNPHYVKAKKHLLAKAGESREELGDFLKSNEESRKTKSGASVDYKQIGQSYVKADKAFREGKYIEVLRHLQSAKKTAANADSDITRVLQAAELATFEKLWLWTQPPGFPVADISFVVDNRDE